jgi:transmembrane sensor
MASHSSLNAIHDRAAHWVARVNESDLSDSERNELQSWLLADARHANEFRAHNAFIGLARDFPPDVQARLDSYVPVQHDQISRSRRRWPAALAAAMLLVLMAAGWVIYRPPSYTTRTGENRTITFEDGSVAYLNTRTEIAFSKNRTRIEALGGKCERRVFLSAGEALFDVVHDPSCPFRVVIGNTEIEVLGTRFNVYRKPNGEVTVTVLEGKVAVRELGSDETLPAWKRELSANQRIVYQSLGLMGDVQEMTPKSVASVTKWRDGMLAAENLPLPEMLEEFGRYTDKRIVIRDPRVAQVHAGGAFTVRDVGAALRDLELIVPIRVIDDGKSFTIESRTNNEDKRNN